jgi:SulP family sulfate permease
VRRFIPSNLFDFSQKVNYKTEILAGLTVAMTMIPESLSVCDLQVFLLVVYAAFLYRLVTAVFMVDLV